MAYFTRSDIEGDGKDFEIPSNFQEADITSLISEIEDIVEDVTKNKFESTSKTIVVDGTGTSSLILYPYTPLPLISISTVKERDDLEDSWTGSNVDTLTATDYYIPEDDKHRIDINEYWSTLRRMLVNPGIWTKGQANFQIVGSFGRASVPASVKRACVLLARDRLKQDYLKGRMVQHERWTDYEYETGVGLTKAYGKTIPVLTGYPEVDILLKPYVIRYVDLGLV